MMPPTDVEPTHPDRSLLSDDGITKRLARQPDPWANLSRHARSHCGPQRRLDRLRA